MNPQNYTSLEMSKRLAAANLFQDKPGAFWRYTLQSKDYVLYDNNTFPYPPVGGLKITYIAVPVVRMMEELKKKINPVAIVLHNNRYAVFPFDGNEFTVGKIIIDENTLADALGEAHLKLKEEKDG